MSEKEQKEIKPGEPLKQSTVTVLSVTIGLCIALIVMGLIWLPQNALVFIIVGLVIAIFGILCTLPNLKAYFRGKKREKLIKQGKLVEEKKKDFNPNHRWGD